MSDPAASPPNPIVSAARSGQTNAATTTIPPPPPSTTNAFSTVPTSATSPTHAPATSVAPNTDPSIASSSKNIVIIGGSYAGLSTAHYLLKHVLIHPALLNYTITVISSSSSVLDRPACPRALISDKFFDQKKLFVDIPPLFKYAEKKFKFIHAKVENVDIASKKVRYKRMKVKSVDTENTTNVDVDVVGTTNNGNTHPTSMGNEGVEEESIEYHSLIIATGSQSSSPLLGLQGDYTELKAHWDKFREALPKAKKILIAGAGPAGIETAGELAEYLNGSPSGFLGGGGKKQLIEIEVVSAGDRGLPDLRKSLGNSAESYLTKMGVSCRTGVKVISVEPEGAGTKFVDLPCTVKLDHGEEIKTDLYIPAIGFRPNTSYLPQTLLDGKKRVKADEYLRVEDTPNVYAIGDCASYARPAIHLIFPAIPIVCHSIRQDLLTEEKAHMTAKESQLKAFKEDKRETQLVPLGTKRGIGSVMGFRIPSFMVWAIKGRDYWLWTTGGLWSGTQFNKE